MPTYLSLNILGKSVLDCLYEYVYTIFTHTILDCYVDHDKPPLIYFNLSVTPDVLEEGASNVTVITCSSDSLIGQFYICHSKNLSGLGRLDVDDEDCCFCLREGSINCTEKFPGWKLEYADEAHRSICRAKLQRVTEDNYGFYQCRIYDTNYPCKGRYGNIHGYNISSHHPSSSIYLRGVTVFLITLFCVCVVLVILSAV